jgi:hypothetical protein
VLLCSPYRSLVHAFALLLTTKVGIRLAPGEVGAAEAEGQKGRRAEGVWDNEMGGEGGPEPQPKIAVEAAARSVAGVEVGEGGLARPNASSPVATIKKIVPEPFPTFCTINSPPSDGDITFS